MGMWDQPDCDCGGLRAWGALAPPNPAVALDEDHPMDVGNRWGILGAGATLRRVQPVFAGLGDDSTDVPPVDTSSTSGSIDSTNTDNSPAVEPTISPVTANPGSPITAQSNSGGASSSGGSSTSGGSPMVSVDEPGSSYLPWVVGGALVLGAGVAGAMYLRRRRRR